MIEIRCLADKYTGPERCLALIHCTGFVIWSPDMRHGDNRDGRTDGLKTRQCIRRSGESGGTIHDNDIRAYIAKMGSYIVDCPCQNGLISMIGKPICQLKSGGWILMKDESFLALGQWGLQEGVHLRAFGHVGLKNAHIRLGASPATGVP